jgi:hypothetical protein
MSAIDSVYNTTSEIGKTTTTIQFYIALCLGLILACCGSYFVSQKSTMVNGTATIASATCNQVTKVTNGKSSISYSCTLSISYVVDGKTYTSNIVADNSTPYMVGTTIDISYDPKNPSNVTLRQMSGTMMGSISCCIGITIVCAASLNYYFASKSKAYAAYQGASSIARLI